MHHSLSDAVLVSPTEWIHSVLVCYPMNIKQVLYAQELPAAQKAFLQRFVFTEIQNDFYGWLLFLDFVVRFSLISEQTQLRGAPVAGFSE